MVMEEDEVDEDVQAKYLKMLYNENQGFDANDRLDNDEIEMAIKGIDRNIKILGERVAKYFDYDHFNEKY